MNMLPCFSFADVPNGSDRDFEMGGKVFVRPFADEYFLNVLFRKPRHMMALPLATVWKGVKTTDMLPRLAHTYVVDRSCGHTKSISPALQCARRVLSNVEHVLFRKPRHVLRLAMNLTAFCHHVGHVVLVRAKEQMRRVDASTYVATVQNIPLPKPTFVRGTYPYAGPEVLRHPCTLAGGLS